MGTETARALVMQNARAGVAKCVIEVCDTHEPEDFLTLMEILFPDNKVSVAVFDDVEDAWTLWKLAQRMEESFALEALA
ncbi:MAG: hypothetical protein NVS3B1_28260 [Marmoricola sp.]